MRGSDGRMEWGLYLLAGRACSSRHKSVLASMVVWCRYGTGYRLGGRVGGLRRIAVPFVAAAPAGARVRTRLRVSPEDEAVLRAAGSHLGFWAALHGAARHVFLDLSGRGLRQLAHL